MRRAAGRPLRGLAVQGVESSAWQIRRLTVAPQATARPLAVHAEAELDLWRIPTDRARRRRSTSWL